MKFEETSFAKRCEPKPGWVRRKNEGRAESPKSRTAVAVDSRLRLSAVKVEGDKSRKKRRASEQMLTCFPRKQSSLPSSPLFATGRRAAGPKIPVSVAPDRRGGRLGMRRVANGSKNRLEAGGSAGSAGAGAHERLSTWVTLGDRLSSAPERAGSMRAREDAANGATQRGRAENASRREVNPFPDGERIFFCALRAEPPHGWQRSKKETYARRLPAPMLLPTFAMLTDHDHD